jgi:putative phosphoribosyl transferase
MAVAAAVSRARHRLGAHARDMAYADRTDAGQRLARELAGYAGRDDVLVLGLVRGGVPVAAQVAAFLGAPLDVLVVRKLGVPWAPEVAFGAVGPGGLIVHNPEVEAQLSPADMARVTNAESEELARRERQYRGGRPPLDLRGKVVIIVDDGLATGATARAAVGVARAAEAARVIMAVPVAAAESLAAVRAEADEVVCPWVPAGFSAVSTFYENFPQVTDDEVIATLAQAHHPA